MTSAFSWQNSISLCPASFRNHDNIIKRLSPSMDLTEEEAIKKRWQEYTELYDKGLNDPDNHDGVITHLQSDILEYEIKCALGSITLGARNIALNARNKANGCNGIPAELLQILKEDAVKVLH